MEKTEIKQIPYIDFSSLKEILNIRINKIKGKAGWYFASQEDFFETIYKAEELERNNNTGALKYILKILNNKNYEYGINTKFDQKSKSFLYLLNYIIVYPRYAKEILKIVDIHIKYIEESKDILNNFLTECIDNRQELVCLYIIQILIKNDLEIDYRIIENYLNINDGNEILRATLIKYLCVNNEDGRYDEKINEYKDSLKETNGINFRLEDWLSKYVLYFHGYILDNECTNENNFFENMKLYKNNDIKFIDFDVL